MTFSRELLGIPQLKLEEEKASDDEVKVNLIIEIKRFKESEIKSEQLDEEESYVVLFSGDSCWRVVAEAFYTIVNEKFPDESLVQPEES